MFEKRVLNLQEILFKDNKEFTGVYSEYFDDGLVKYECTYKAGLKNGTEWIYYSNGAAKEVRTYKKGELRVYEEYYPNFALKRKVEFKDEVKDGLEIIFTEDSDFEAAQIYKNGKKIEEIKL